MVTKIQPTSISSRCCGRRGNGFSHHPGESAFPVLCCRWLLSFECTLSTGMRRPLSVSGALSHDSHGQPVETNHPENWDVREEPFPLVTSPPPRWVLVQSSRTAWSLVQSWCCVVPWPRHSEDTDPLWPYMFHSAQQS